MWERFHGIVIRAFGYEKISKENFFNLEKNLSLTQVS